MFGRSRRGPAPDSEGPRHPDLPMLSVAQYGALEQLAADAFTRRGVPVTGDGHGVLRGAGDQQFGLHNLAVLVSRVPFRRWSSVVDEHAASLVAANEAAARPVRPEQVLLKLRRADELPCPVDYDASTRLPGLLSLVAVDHPTHVAELFRHDDVTALGDHEEVRELALANLRALPPPEHHALPADGARADSTVHVFASDDFFGAARVLVLDALLAEALRLERPEHGCVVAVPNRRLLLVHPVEGPGVVPALNAMAVIARREHDEQPGPVSAELYYLPQAGPGQQLTARDDDGAVTVRVEGAFGEALQRLGLTGPDT